MARPPHGLPIIPTVLAGNKQFHWINDTVNAELIRCDHSNGKCPGCGSERLPTTEEREAKRAAALEEAREEEQREQVQGEERENSD